MRALIVDNQWIYFENITIPEEQILWAEFSVSKPGAYVDPNQMGNWDGITRKYNRGQKRIARPLLSMLRGICEKNKLPLAVIDKRPEWKYKSIDVESINDDFLPGITLAQYQIDCIRKLASTECGIVDITTGGGKCVCYESMIELETGSIQIGVFCSNLEEEQIRIVNNCRVMGPFGFVDVKAIYKTDKRQIISITLESNQTLRGVHEHRVYTDRGWNILSNLSTNDKVLTTSGFVLIKCVCEESSLDNCYDLQLSSDDTDLSNSYYTNGILSHNTEIISGVCKAIPCPTLIIADQRIIIDQIKARLELRQISEVIGLFYAGSRPNGEMIVVGSIQSLMTPTKPPMPPNREPGEDDASYGKKMAKWELRLKAFKTRRANAKTLQKYAKNAEMIIVDEADKATGIPYKNLFRHLFKGRRRFGLSGTVFDPSKPVEALVLQEHLGSVIFQETREHLTKLGRIIPCEYTMIAYGNNGDPKEGSAYDIAYDEHITNSDKFHRMVAKLCVMGKKAPKDGTLILVNREALGWKLEAAIKAAGLTVNFILGKTPQKKRNELLRAFERREFDVLIGGKVVDRGLDLAGGCENLIIATGGKLQSGFLQKIGRAIRHNSRGISKVYDFMFRCNRYLYSHSRDRLKIMTTTGYKTTVVFPGGSVDGADLVKSRFRISKKLLQK